MTLDDDFADEDSGADLELDVPAGHAASTPRTSAAAPPPHPADMADHALPPPGASKKPPPAVPSSAPRMEQAGPPSTPRPVVSQTPPQPPPPPPPPPKPTTAAMVAKYPLPPQKVWESPMYAWKVLLRQWELRQDLASLRKRRSPDVPLYEAALKAHDPKTFWLGLALTCAGLAVMSFFVFLPVIIRNLGD
jgi:hypothetical protein